MASTEESFRDRVFRYYQEHNPAKIEAVDEIVQKYRGRESELWRKLSKKYAQNAEKLNFRSASFDAALALKTTDLLPPFPSAPALDNISKFRHLLPTDSEEFESRVAHRTATTTSTTTPTTTTKPPGSSTSRGRSLMDTMVDPIREGPLSLLWRAVNERQRISVQIRSSRSSIRGSCQGLLKAFDRHMNLYLIDVLEAFLPPTATRKQRLPNSTFRVTRNLPNLFIRGDTIVTVSFVSI